MIDIDKYEGHTEGEWDWDNICRPPQLMDTHGSPIAEMFEGWNTKEATAQLIADAPLLLAEVKRLLEVIEQHGIDISFDPRHNEEDEAILYEWLDATSQGYWGSVYEFKVMKQEESE